MKYGGLSEGARRIKGCECCSRLALRWAANNANLFRETRPAMHRAITTKDGKIAVVVRGLFQERACLFTFGLWLVFMEGGAFAIDFQEFIPLKEDTIWLSC